MEESQLKKRLLDGKIIELSDSNIKLYFYGILTVTIICLLYFFSKKARIEENGNVLLMYTTVFLLIFINLYLFIYGGNARIIGDTLYVNKLVGQQSKVPIKRVEIKRNIYLGKLNVIYIGFPYDGYENKVLMLNSRKTFADYKVLPKEIINLAKEMYRNG